MRFTYRVAVIGLGLAAECATGVDLAPTPIGYDDVSKSPAKSGTYRLRGL